jgi:hypothetical protein
MTNEVNQLRDYVAGLEARCDYGDQMIAEARALLAMVRRMFREDSPLEDMAAVEQSISEYWERHNIDAYEGDDR